MLTKEEIRKKLTENPDWAPEYNEPDELWDLYDEVREEMDIDGGDEDEEDKDKDKEGGDMEEEMDEDQDDDFDWDDDEF